MEKKIAVYIENIEQYIEVKPYTSLQELSKYISIEIDKKNIIGALVDHKAKDTQYRVHRKCNVKFIDKNHPEGYRIYINSLFFILYKAVHDIYPTVRLSIEHSASNGYFCQLKNGNDSPDRLLEKVEAIKIRMQQIITENHQFDYDVLKTNEIRQIYEQQGLINKARLLNRKNEIYSQTYKLENLYHNFFGVLAARTSQIDIFDLQPYYKGMLLIPPSSRQPHKVNTPITQRKMFNVLREFKEWSEVLELKDIEDLNQFALSDKGSEIIKISESLHEKKISAIAQEIAATKGSKIVLVSGPSSSGKTSFSKRLTIHLKVEKKQAISISMDDYFVDRTHTPIDENGDYDFETIKAVDTEKFNLDLNALVNGEEVEKLRYNFAEGKREHTGQYRKLKPNQILIIEGIHALNPCLVENIKPEAIVRIYVSALITTSFDSLNRVATSDLRLLRRLVRDTNYRGMDVATVFDLWRNVRKGEEMNIFPYQENADYMFNSALPYEIAALKPFVESKLKRLDINSEFYFEAHRLIKMLSYIEEIPQKEIPPTSLIREFIGGSSFKY